MIKAKILILFLAVSAILGCAVGERYTGNGNLIKQQRNVGDYTQVENSGFIDVVLTDGKIGNLTIEAESNLADFVETEVKDGALQIKTKDGVNISTNKGIKVYVPVDNRLTLLKTSGSGNVTAAQDLNSAELTVKSSGSGDVELNRVKAENFHAKISGSGYFTAQNLQSGATDITISGSGDAALGGGNTTNLSLQLSGSANFKAPDFAADNVDVSVSGSGNVTVNAQKTLSASVSGSGNIYYSGNATLTKQSVSGIGTIQKAP